MFNNSQLAVCITTTAMEEKKEPQRNAGGRGITDYIPAYKVASNLFRRAIGCYTCQQLVTHETKMPAKITKFLVTMDETFLNKDSDGLQVQATESALEKVTNTVGTFLPDDTENMRIVRVITRIFPLHKFNNYHLHAYN